MCVVVKVLLPLWGRCVESAQCVRWVLCASVTCLLCDVCSCQSSVTSVRTVCGECAMHALSASCKCHVSASWRVVVKVLLSLWGQCVGSVQCVHWVLCASVTCLLCDACSCRSSVISVRTVCGECAVLALSALCKCHVSRVCSVMCVVVKVLLPLWGRCVGSAQCVRWVLRASVTCLLYASSSHRPDPVVCWFALWSVSLG